MSEKSNITIDVTEVLTLGDDVVRAKEIGVRQVTERAEQIVCEEAPEAKDKAATGIGGNLKQGVTSDVKVGKNGARGEVIVTARSGRLDRREATLHLPSGKTKKVTLRAVPSFNYAEAVATGTGEYGPKRARIRPKKAKALLVPVTSPATINGKPEAYIVSGGQTFVMRRSLKGMKPNPYDERAARRLEREAPQIFDNVVNGVMEGTL
ncbi:MAG: hypothetical protein ICV60_05780 [Pyrinomonadaceae bacterium]|nr:hypothetical protein [Pyrinomonadaceae bacterium]